MMGFNSIRHFSKFIALNFVFSILAVIFCDIWCSVDQSLLYTATSQTNTHETHHHKDSKSDNHLHNEGDKAAHDHSSTSDLDDCCKDITTQFYHSLFKVTESTFVVAPALLAIAPAYPVLVHQDLIETQWELYKVPPNTLYTVDLCILFESFLI